MPRNGDQSSDNGPLDAGENLIHGASGDPTLKHTQNVAPLPPTEKGAALPGLPASGGGSAGTHQGAHAGDSNKPPVVEEVTKSS